MRWFVAILALASSAAAVQVAAESQQQQGVRQDPCPDCPDEKGQFRLTLQEFSAQNLKEFEASTAQESETVLGALRESVARAQDRVQQVRRYQMEATIRAARNASEHQEMAAAEMRAALGRALTLGEAAVMNASRVWARSQVQMTLANDTAYSLKTTAMLEVESLALQKEAERLLAGAVQAGKSLANISGEAQNALQRFHEADVEAFAEAQGEKNRAFWAEANETEKEGELAKELVDRAHSMAFNILNRSKIAEAGASQALQTARRNTRRIAQLKAKVQAAQQQAQLAKALVTEDA